MYNIRTMLCVLKEVLKEKDIPKELVETPIADLLRYHNMFKDFKEYTNPDQNSWSQNNWI